VKDTRKFACEGGSARRFLPLYHIATQIADRHHVQVDKVSRERSLGFQFFPLGPVHDSKRALHVTSTGALSYVQHLR
jgi:hypothetical protein